MPKVKDRKHGTVIRTNVEILTYQWHKLDECSKKLKMTKGEIIAQALTLWFGSIERGKK